MFFLLDGHNDINIMKISYHFPKISEDSPKFFRRSHERCRAFSENLRRFPKIPEDCQDFRGRLEDVSIITNEFKQNL